MDVMLMHAPHNVATASSSWQAPNFVGGRAVPPTPAPRLVCSQSGSAKAALCTVGAVALTDQPKRHGHCAPLVG